MKIQIKPGLEIGDDCPPFIVAEVGSNWTSLDDCLMSIEKVKECGADAVKFQLFTGQSLYGLPAKIESKHSLPIEWLPKLKERADRCGIEFMCSAFSPELLDAVDPFVNIHKLASAEMCHVRMLEKLWKVGKPIFMSTGAHTAEEIGKALSILHDDYVLPPCHVVLMYCVAAYPARLIELAHIQGFKFTFKALVGYSDHSVDVLYIPYGASQDACVIEKHVSFIDSETPDKGHSLNQHEFRRMVKRIRCDFTGDEMIGPSSEEAPMLLRHNRRLLAITDIAVGDTLQEGVNFGIYRSLKDAPDAYSPFLINDVIGKKAKRVIMAGDGIGEGDV